MSSSSSFSLPEVRESLRDARTFGRLEKPLRCIKFARRKDVRGHIAFGRKRKGRRTKIQSSFVSFVSESPIPARSPASFGSHEVPLSSCSAVSLS